MARPSARQVAAGMWSHRPAVSELLFWTVIVLVAHLLISLPVALLAVLAGLVVVGAMLWVTLDELTTTPVIETGPDEGGHDAD